MAKAKQSNHKDCCEFVCNGLRALPSRDGRDIVVIGHREANPSWRLGTAGASTLAVLLLISTIISRCASSVNGFMRIFLTNAPELSPTPQHVTSCKLRLQRIFLWYNTNEGVPSARIELAIPPLRKGRSFLLSYEGRLEVEDRGIEPLTGEFVRLTVAPSVPHVGRRRADRTRKERSARRLRLSNLWLLLQSPDIGLQVV